MELRNDRLRLVPERSTFAPGVSIGLDVVDPSGSGLAEGATLVVTSVLDEVLRRPVDAGATRVEVPALATGGYGVALLVDDEVAARTAFDVLADPFQRPRYGFVANLDDSCDVEAVVGHFRRAHLNLAQFYDWGYRHAELMPPQRRYVDPLGQERDLDVVNRLAAAFGEAGTVPLGYAAVYAVANAEADQWAEELLLRADGVPYRLGDDFLTLLDPAAARWLEHFTAMLRRALDGTELHGFHLDQYGWPKRSLRGDGAIVDLDVSYRSLIEGVRAALPEARFMFNNVNDFGTARTADTAQDASYIEVWPPHDELGDLGLLADRTRSLRPEHPPILSAYLSCYTTDEQERADAAARLVMATAFSHGAAHLLLGEAGHALTDPYYPRNHRLPAESVDMFATWYDTAVRWGDLLYDVEQFDVTEFMTGGINTDLVLEADGVRFSTKARPGTVWTRVVRCSRGLVLHLINLTAQDEVAWDHGKNPTRSVEGVRLAFAPTTGRESAVWIEPGADPVALSVLGTNEGRATDALSASQSSLLFGLPPLRDWGMVFLPFDQ